jgi:hypothetical protein
VSSRSALILSSRTPIRDLLLENEQATKIPGLTAGVSFFTAIACHSVMRLHEISFFSRSLLISWSLAKNLDTKCQNKERLFSVKTETLIIVLRTVVAISVFAASIAASSFVIGALLQRMMIECMYSPTLYLFIFIFHPHLGRLRKDPDRFVG